jgi:hypothetical protein
MCLGLDGVVCLDILPLWGYSVPEFIEWLGNPQQVNSLEYVTGLIRAVDQAGLTISRAHISTIKQLIEREQSASVKPDTKEQ